MKKQDLVALAASWEQLGSDMVDKANGTADPSEANQLRLVGITYIVCARTQERYRRSPFKKWRVSSEVAGVKRFLDGARRLLLAAHARRRMGTNPQ